MNVHDGSMTALFVLSDSKYIASSSEDGTIIIWDALSNTIWHKVPQQDNTGHADMVCTLAFSRDNIYLASVSHDEHIIMWTVVNG